MIRRFVKNACFAVVVSAAAGDAQTQYYGDDTDIEWDEDERFDYAFTATGMVYPDILFLNGSVHLAGWTNTNIDGTSYGGWWGQPRLRMDAATGSHTVGKGPHTIVMGNAFPYYGIGDGSGKLYRNDVLLGDTDDDGLGDNLEAFLGTDPEDIDTDHDGFTDALETIGGAHHPECVDTAAEQGITADDPGAGCAINLGTFGADPNTRDIFVTVIWMAPETGTSGLYEKLDIALPEIKALFESDWGMFDTPKPDFQLLFDYGQSELGLFAAGGERIPYQTTFCIYDAAADECIAGPSCQYDPDCDPGYYCRFGKCIPISCGSMCRPHDADHPHPTYGDPHSPWNLERTYWGDEPLFPVNRRGLWIPFVIYYKTPPYSEGSGGICVSFTEDEQYVPVSAHAVYPGMPTITNYDWATNEMTRRLMHELGHALRLTHSPASPLLTDQPNHISVMNYAYQSTSFGSLGYGSDLDSDLTARPPLAWLGEEVTQATTETECCCFGEGCVAESADDQIPFECCPYVCGTYDEGVGACANCNALWLPPFGVCMTVVAHEPIVQWAAVTGVSQESQCCCDGAGCLLQPYVTAPDYCHPPAQKVEVGDNEFLCGICNAKWYEDACYYGGLDERVGVGANGNEATHLALVEQIQPLIETLADSFLAPVSNTSHPFNIDWNASSTETPSGEPYNLSARNVFAKLSQGQPPELVPSPFVGLEPMDEWARIADCLATAQWGIQGLGLPPFCDGTFGCPEGLDCIRGWCLPPETEPPEECVPEVADTPCWE